MPLFNPVSPEGGAYEAGPLNVPNVASFTTGWFNQGTSTAVDVADGVALVPQNNDQIHGLLVPTPSAPFDCYCRVDQAVTGPFTGTALTNMISGIVLKDNADTEYITFGNYYQRASGVEQGGNRIVAYNWSSPTTVAATLFDAPVQEPARWLRVNVTSTTITFYISNSGKSDEWVTISSALLSAFIDTADRIGIFSFANANAAPNAYFKQFGFAQPT